MTTMMSMLGTSQYFPTDERIEACAVAHAFGLLAAAGDAKAAKVRLQQITDATAEHVKAREAAEKIVAEAEVKQKAAEQADADITKKTAAFQLWLTGPRRITKSARTASASTKRRNPSESASWPRKRPISPAGLQRMIAGFRA
jgi:hypothetical protein